MNKCLMFFLALGLTAAPPVEKKLYPATGGNDKIEIEAKLLLSKEEAQQALGADPGEGIIVVLVKVSPKGEDELSLSPDDFYLKTDRDGQRTQPFSPSQIAGSASLVITTNSSGGTTVSDRPRRRTSIGIPGLGSQSVGGGAAPNPAATEVKDGDPGDKENPLLAKLEAKALKPASTKEPVQGLLYFPIEGKQRRKDLELLYKGPAGRLVMRWP